MHCSGLDVTDHCSAQQTSQEKNFMTVLRNVGISSVPINTRSGGAKRMEPGFFQWFPVTRQEAMGTKGNAGGSI